MRLRPYVINVRLNAEELAQVRALADGNDISVSAFMRKTFRAFTEKKKRSGGGEVKRIFEAQAT